MSFTSHTGKDATALSGVGVLAPHAQAMYIGTAGDLAVKTARGDGTTVTFAGLVSGTILPVAIKEVVSFTGTVTTLIALYPEAE